MDTSSLCPGNSGLVGGEAQPRAAQVDGAARAHLLWRTAARDGVAERQGEGKPGAGTALRAGVPRQSCLPFALTPHNRSVPAVTGYKDSEVSNG